MISVQVKLKLRPAQERMLGRWLWHMTGVYNWAVRKIELDAKDRRYHSQYEMDAMLGGHSVRLGVPYNVIRHTARRAHSAWERCFRKTSRRPHMKGRRNRLNSFLVTEDISIRNARLRLVGIGPVAFHQMEIPDGKIKTALIVRRASGWYACLTIGSEPRPIPIQGEAHVGIDPGFSALITLSSGERIDPATEMASAADRIAQAQRGNRRKLTARLRQREGNRRRDRNHKLSRRLVADHSLIAWSKDSHRSIARRFGKSVAGAAHGQLRSMLAYKCSRIGGREFIEVPSKDSTRTCSSCGALSGPTGLAGLKVRVWECACGAIHDRDVNAAVNTLKSALGMSVESGREAASGIAS
jgi:transposase